MNAQSKETCYVLIFLYISVGQLFNIFVVTNKNKCMLWKKSCVVFTCNPTCLLWKLISSCPYRSGHDFWKCSIFLLPIFMNLLIKLRGLGNISSHAPLWWIIFSNFSSPFSRLALGATISERSLHLGHNPLNAQSFIDVWRTCAAAKACTAADSFVAERSKGSSKIKVEGFFWFLFVCLSECRRKFYLNHFEG